MERNSATSVKGSARDENRVHPPHASAWLNDAAVQDFSQHLTFTGARRLLEENRFPPTRRTNILIIVVDRVGLVVFHYNAQKTVSRVCGMFYYRQVLDQITGD